jgi:hypothetical protein
MSIFERLRKWHEDKFNRSRVRLACFLLVRCLESVDWGSARLPRRGDFLPMIGEGMSLAPIIFLLIILLFGFDSTGQVEPRPKHNYGLQQINLVAFKDIARASHPTKEVVPAVPRVVTKIPTHAQ